MEVPTSSLSASDLRDQLGQAQVRWMQKICRSNQKAVNGYRTDKHYLQKGIWYVTDLRKACIEMKQQAMLKFLESNDKWVVGYAPPKYFSRIPDSSNFTGSRIMHFIAKKDVMPAEALKAAVAGLTIGECGMAYQISRYGALLDVLGEDKFNRLFGSEVGQPINIGYMVDDALQPMRLFVDFTQKAKMNKAGTENNRPIEIGQGVLIRGAKDFNLKKPFDHRQSHNALCCDSTPGHQRFLSLGSNEEGESEEEYHQKLLEGYNCPQDPLFIVPDSMKATFKQLCPTMELLKNHTVTEIDGYDPGSVQDFKIDLIKKIVKLPLEQVSMAFVNEYNSI